MGRGLSSGFTCFVWSALRWGLPGCRPASPVMRPLLLENQLEGQLDEKICVLAPAGEIEGSEWQENESKEGLQRLNLQIVF